MRKYCYFAVPVVLLIACVATIAEAQQSIPAFGLAVTENFNTLAYLDTSSVLPVGWVLSESGTNANTTYRPGTGSLTTGDTYSFGALSDPERAFGTLRSGTLVPLIGAAFRNDAGGVLGSIDISYTGEQWRLGTANRGPDRLFFEYSLNATSLTTGTWTAVAALDFSSPITTGSVGALDGNAAANRTAISGSISGLLVAPTAIVWIRWQDFDASSSDDGLAVDDFSLTAHEAPVSARPASLGSVKATYR